MNKLLIVTSAKSFSSALQEIAKDEFEVMACEDGEKALELLESFQPDALVINLCVPVLDGLTVLRAIYPNTPRAVLALIPGNTEYIEQSLIELGVKYALQTPVKPEAVLENLLSMLVPGIYQQRLIHSELQALGLSTKLAGYRHLLIAITRYKMDPNQGISKELYPAVAKESGCYSKEQVEHAIRTVVLKAWSQRDNDLWKDFFPKCQKHPPSNKVFIATIASRI